MATLGREDILRLVEGGSIRIEPFSPNQVGPGSIDLHLGNTFRVFEKTRDIFHIREDADYKTITRTVTVDEESYFLTMPQELVQGITKETITLPHELSARIEGRSRFARVGLLVHLSSGFIQPGSNGKVVLEILNVSSFPLALHPGTAICQIIIEEARGAPSYRGAFAGQTAP
jgi:dCTP deaminase